MDLKVIRIALGLIGLVVASPARPAPVPAAHVCEHAAMTASERWSVPLDVLRAIALAETGHKTEAGFVPWPWALNPGGAGTWYPDRTSALRAARAHRAAGRRNLDLGCFQINFRWHGHAFATLDEMLDPAANADYAARFLAELYEEFGDWRRAAAAYHSRTPDLAARYLARFERIYAGLPDIEVAGTDLAAAAPDPPKPPAQTRAWPLADPSGTRSSGSLVALGGSGAGALWSDGHRTGWLR
ncbi:MAG: lytic transglycosylase domain-containing protein [Pseudomonadota bacterium]